MLCVARDEHVLGDVDSCSGTLLYRDDGQTIEEFIQYLLALLRGLRGDPVSDLGVGIQHASVISDLS